jgi:hypothetical protein
MIYLFCVLAGSILGFLIGFLWALESVSNECIRLGGFYNGKTVFKCTQVKVVQ